MTRHPTRALALCLSAFLAACGGGHDPRSDASDPLVTASTTANDATTAKTSEYTASASDAQYWSESAALNRAEVQQPSSSSSDASTQKSFGVSTKAFVAPSAPLYRFYNINTGAHLFTRDLTERDRTLNTLPQFRYEGAVFSAWASADAGLSPVYRFYNTLTGAHFFTISETEKAQIQASRPEMNLDGVAYYAAKTALAGTTGLYRFYHRQKGFHFYTTSVAERDSIVANLSATYNYEGVGYYVNAAVGNYDKALAHLAGMEYAYGNINATGKDARFKGLEGLSCNNNNSLAVIDNRDSFYNYNGEIRTISLNGTVNSLAGNNQIYSSGLFDGTGKNARFHGAESIAFDRFGTAYFADNQTVRSVSSTGAVKTIAGSLQDGLIGYVNGSGEAARFYINYGIAIDSKNNIFISDNNHTIRKVTQAGIVSTLAGPEPKPIFGSTAGYADGIGSTARFAWPGQMAIDTNDNIFVVDTVNYSIRKITPSGEVSTFAGQRSRAILDGQGVAAKFIQPKAIAIDRSTNALYVSDGLHGNVVRKISSTGKVTTVVGAPESVSLQQGALPASMAELQGLAVCNNRLYMASAYGAIFWADLP